MTKPPARKSMPQPGTGSQLLKLAEVQQRTGLSKAEVFRHLGAPLLRGRRVAGWPAEKVEAWCREHGR